MARDLTIFVFALAVGLAAAIGTWDRPTCQMPPDRTSYLKGTIWN